MFRRSILAVILLATTSLLAQKTLTATEAKDHIGEPSAAKWSAHSGRKAVAAAQPF
jgi:hypothetical protein